MSILLLFVPLPFIILVLLALADLILLCHIFCRFGPMVVRQHGQRGRVCTSATVSRRRTEAMENAT